MIIQASAVGQPICGAALLMTTLVELRPFISLTIPAILRLLKDERESVRMAAAGALLKLSLQGETASSLGLALLMKS
jgi:HEAT repeat protein